MKFLSRFPWIIVGLVALFLATPVQADSAQWTFMVFLNADNNLESAGISDFLEMAQVGSDEKINIVVQFDRTPGESSAYGDWTAAKRFLVARDMTPTAENALADLGEINMGAQATLTDFVQWARSAYPAQKYALVLWNHGSGWRVREAPASPLKGVSYDDTSNDHLSIAEVRQALAAAGGGVDLIGFDACLMNMVEVAYDMRDQGEVMAGSEETEPNDGWPYETILADLAANPLMDAAGLGAVITDRYWESYGELYPFSSLDLSVFNDFASELDAFADALMDHWQDDVAAVTAASANMRAAVESVVLSNRGGLYNPNARGLAIYFPKSGPLASYSAANLQVVADARWRDFLTAFSGMADSWIAKARTEAQEFYYADNVDLYDFCLRLENAANSGGRPGYSLSEVAANFQDIAATGLDLNLGDDESATVSPPFVFSYWGRRVSQLTVTSNGLIGLVAGDYSFNNSPIPSEIAFNAGQAFLAPFWDDLDPGQPGGAVQVATLGAAPEREYVIQWAGALHASCRDTEDGVTFQVRLRENGEILFSYQDVSFNCASYDAGASATVGLQRSGNVGQQYSCNEANLSNGLGLLWTPLPWGCPRSVLDLLLTE